MEHFFVCVHCKEKLKFASSGHYNDVYLHEECVNDFISIKKEDIRLNMIKKWQHTGLLDNLNGDVREETAQLYESQASHLLEEVSVPSSFENVTFPMVRRIFSQTINFNIEKENE